MTTILRLLFIGLLLPAALHGQRADEGLAKLEQEIVRLSAIASGKVGVGIIHLESGRELFINADEPYPMASTYRVPIAVQLLTRVDSGLVKLDSMIAIKPSDLHPGSGTLTSLFNDPCVSLSVRNLRCTGAYDRTNRSCNV